MIPAEITEQRSSESGQLLESLVQEWCHAITTPEHFSIKRNEGQESILLEILADSHAARYLIGTKGQTVEAMRLLCRQIGWRHGKRVSVEVVIWGELG